MTSSGPDCAPRRVIAAISDDSAALAVLATASAITTLFDATVEALHVGEEDAALMAAANAAGVTLRNVAGRPVEVLAQAAGAGDVVAVVIGARGTVEDKRPAGSTALQVITLQNQCPVVVVPPDARVHRSIESVLVPLDGTATSATALEEIVELARDAAARIVVAHVLQPRALPAFSDHLPHEVHAWSEEFIARYCPAAVDAALELRVGEPHRHVLDILRESRCDLVALGWSQDLTRGRAAVVRQLLAESPVPVLLTPVASAVATTPGAPSTVARRS